MKLYNPPSPLETKVISKRFGVENSWRLDTYLATGGFQANVQMRVQHLGRFADSLILRGSRYNTGDGLNMAIAAGAHVHCEKPTALHRWQAVEMRDAALAAGRCAADGLPRVFYGGEKNRRAAAHGRRPIRHAGK